MKYKNIKSEKDIIQWIRLFGLMDPDQESKHLPKIMGQSPNVCPLLSPSSPFIYLRLFYLPLSSIPFVQSNSSRIRQEIIIHIISDVDPD